MTAIAKAAGFATVADNTWATPILQRPFEQGVDGGNHSLVEHRASVEGPATTAPESLLRVSIGLEHGDGLIADLDQALRVVETSRLPL